jgi:hypothetical protein
MAKNTQAAASQGWTPSFSASSLSSEVPTLATGVYAGRLTNVSITGKENKQYFQIRKSQQWNKVAKVFEDVVIDGEVQYEITGMIMIQGILTSKKAQQVLGRDEPGFFRMINISFTKDMQADESRNQQLANFLSVLGLDKEPFETYVNFEFDSEITVPSELAEIPNIVNMLNALNYYKELFNIICNSCKDQNVRVHIERVTDKVSGEVTNEVAGGRFSTSCGFLSYEEGSENDVIEE